MAGSPLADLKNETAAQLGPGRARRPEEWRCFWVNSHQGTAVDPCRAADEWLCQNSVHLLAPAVGAGEHAIEAHQARSLHRGLLRAALDFFFALAMRGEVHGLPAGVSPRLRPFESRFEPWRRGPLRVAPSAAASAAKAPKAARRYRWARPNFLGPHVPTKSNQGFSRACPRVGGGGRPCRKRRNVCAIGSCFPCREKARGSG